MRGRLMFALVVLVATGPAAAEPPPEQADPDSPIPEALPLPPDAMGPEGMAPEHELADLVREDSEFGPLVQIERIDITGNTATRSEIILRALRIATGDVLHSSDKRLRDARFKVLALGYFRDVALAIHKGSQRGRVVVEVRVVERGTLVLNRLWFGTTALSPWWIGADVTERNLLGRGLAVGGGVIGARHGGIEGARDQFAAELRLAASSVRGTPWGASVAATAVRGSEPYRVSGAASDSSSMTQRAFPYRRLGLRFGATHDVSALTRLSMTVRAESVDTSLPFAPVQVLRSGVPVAIDLHLVPGSSRIVTTSITFDRDTRPDPILPHAGGHVVASAELGTSVLGSDYDFATLFGSFEHYWPLRSERHAIAIKLAGGLVIGSAPRFDRIHVADVDRMLTPRALGLVLSTAAPLAILGTLDDKPSYGDLGGSANLEYAFQLFRGSGKRRVYGGDMFFGVGLWGLAERSTLRARDTALFDALPIDLYADAGVRLDTDIGTFELTLANALGRLR
jgi:hypothetical protein